MAMAALIAANVANQSAATTAAKVRSRYAKFDTSLLYNVNDDYATHPYPTNEELGIQDVTRTTLGQPVLKGDKDVYGLPKAETKWEVFKKMWIPNFKYKGRRRK
jgi:hypothetical protein